MNMAKCAYMWGTYLEVWNIRIHITCTLVHNDNKKHFNVVKHINSIYISYLEHLIYDYIQVKKKAKLNKFYLKFLEDN